jgi:hypothetical protein
VCLLSDESTNGDAKVCGRLSVRETRTLFRFTGRSRCATRFACMNYCFHELVHEVEGEFGEIRSNSQGVMQCDGKGDDGSDVETDGGLIRR